MSNISVTRLEQCRLCGGTALDNFLGFNDVPFFDEVVTKDKVGDEFLYPMEVYFCENCRSVQSQHDVDTSHYYASYEYVASRSPFVRSYMEKLAAITCERFAVKPGDRVVEIGAADGFLLRCFQAHGTKVLGFEAAGNLVELAEASGVTVVKQLFEAETVRDLPEEFQSVQVVALLHAFDHLAEPVAFLKAVKEVLDPSRGVLILEVHDLADIVAKFETALFGHEHATYLHVGSMKRLLESQGLRLIDFNFVDKKAMRGSSMLIAATPQGSIHRGVEGRDLKAFEPLDRLETLRDFSASVADAYARLRDYIAGGKQEGRRFGGYGGWGRGVTTLAMAQIGPRDLAFVADRNPGIHGCFTPGSKIEIVSPDRVTRDDIDELIVFNYAYIDEIREAHRAFLDAGGIITSVMDVLAARPPES